MSCCSKWICCSCLIKAAACKLRKLQEKTGYGRRLCRINQETQVFINYKSNAIIAICLDSLAAVCWWLQVAATPHSSTAMALGQKHLQLLLRLLLPLRRLHAATAAGKFSFFWVSKRIENKCGDTGNQKASQLAKQTNKQTSRLHTTKACCIFYALATKDIAPAAAKWFYTRDKQQQQQQQRVLSLGTTWRMRNVATAWPTKCWRDARCDAWLWANYDTHGSDYTHTHIHMHTYAQQHSWSCWPVQRPCWLIAARLGKKQRQRFSSDPNPRAAFHS